jgi:hypothetical protein
MFRRIHNAVVSMAVGGSILLYGFGFGGCQSLLDSGGVGEAVYSDEPLSGALVDVETTTDKEGYFEFD